METNPYYETYRHQSQILDRRGGSAMSEVIIEGNPSNSRGHLLKLRGSEKHPGKYYYPEGSKWMPCTLENLKGQEKQLEEEWKDHLQGQINLGERPPQKWPPHLLDRKERLEARRMVAMEEIHWLEEHLTKAEEAKHTREKKPVQPKFWGGGSLRNGILVEFCGWDVSKNDEGVLAIDDPTSPYNTMPIWRLKSAVLNPLDAEHRLRQREEVKAALAENRKRNHVAYPSVPVYIKEKDQIQYPGDYHNETIKKLKQSEE